MDIYVSYTCLKITSVFHITLTEKTKTREKFSRICKSETIITEILLSCSPRDNSYKRSGKKYNLIKL